jgi:hypothetical protein
MILSLSAWSALMGAISGLCVTNDESLLESHDRQAAVAHFVSQESMPPKVADELRR